MEESKTLKYCVSYNYRNLNITNMHKLMFQLLNDIKLTR